jgi:hypothetical protein
MKEADMKQIGSWIAQVVFLFAHHELPQEKEARLAFLKKVRADMQTDETLLAIKAQVTELAHRFPAP